MRTIKTNRIFNFKKVTTVKSKEQDNTQNKFNTDFTGDDPRDIYIKHNLFGINFRNI